MAIIVAITLGLLLVVVGLVIDLGYLYTRKTELQKAADAAALAGAKEINGTAAGINNAVTMAIDLANDNSVNFGGDAVEIAAANIEFGPTPDGPWSSVAASQGTPGGKRFIKVDTSGIALSTVQTWFMRVFQWGFGGIESTTTFGRAVAGPDIVETLPIAACVLDPDDCPPNGTGQCGYRKGQSYKLSVINPIGPGTLYWINPVTTNAGECSGTGSTDYTLPFVCQGVVAANVGIASEVLTNTGVSVPQLAALDSRFDDYPSSAKCDPATEMAQDAGVTLMVGHTFEYSPPVVKIKEIIDSGELGEIYFITSSRVNLGLHQKDVSVIWDLAPHDFSMLFAWVGEYPERKRAFGRSCLRGGKPDVAFVTMQFPSRTVAEMQLSWLSPVKLRRTMIVGSRKMLLYDDTESVEKVKIYDPGVDQVVEPDSFGEFQLSYRTGDVVSPHHTARG